MQNSVGFVTLENEEALITFAKWLAWLICMVIFIIILIYVMELNQPTKCNLDDDQFKQLATEQI